MDSSVHPPLVARLHYEIDYGRDDLGVTGDGRLVVSERALALLRTGVLDHCDADPYLADEARPPR
jgi:hypothetical protein